MEASSFSTSPISQLADDTVGDINARASVVTHEVSSVRQATADGDSGVWKRSESAPVKAVGRRPARESGDGGVDSPSQRCATATGVGLCAAHNAGIVLGSGCQGGCTGPLTATHSPANHTANHTAKGRGAERLDRKGEVPSVSSGAATAATETHRSDSTDSRVSHYLSCQSERRQFTKTEDDYENACANVAVADNTSENDTAELTARGLSLSSGSSARFGLARPPVATEEDEASCSPSSNNSKESGQYLVLSSQRRQYEPAPVSCPGTLVPPHFRLLESRRGSSVTFILPAHVSSGENSSSSSSHRSISPEEGAQLQERYYSLSARRMSAPELPPIADRERPRPPSRSTSRSSLNQLTAAVSNKNIFTRLTNGAGLHRNHSDSSLKALWSTSQGATQSSASVSSYPSGAGGLGGGGGGGGGTPGPGEYGLAPATLHRSSSRALSWCATDNSAGSVPKLETLFEQKISNNLVHTSSLAAPGTPPHVLENSVHNSSISNHHHHNNNNSSPQSNAKIPPRSVSVNGVRATDSQEVARMKGRRKRQQSECGAGEMETLATIEHFGRLKLSGMRRSQSDNKLVDKKNVRNARLNSSRHLSVSKTEKLVHQRRSSRHGGTSTVSGTKGGMRRVSSVSAINTITANSRTRLDSNQDSEHVEGGGSEDSEEEEERSVRIREWLQGLDCADAPPEPVIDYADDPPQTDTALHIVYKDGR